MMMNLKKSVFVVFVLMSFLYQKGIAQTQHEVGVLLNYSEIFSVLYKKQKDDKSFMRYRLNTGRISFSEANARFSGNFEFAIGKENRKQLKEKLFFIYGIEPAFGVSYNRQNRNDAFSISPSLGYVLGIRYEFLKQLIIGLEVIPALNMGFQRVNNITSVSAGFNFQTAGLAVAYRFEK